AAHPAGCGGAVRSTTSRRITMRVMRLPLLARIRAREAKVGVVGLGYVGLPLGMAFAEAGFHVTGFDVDPAKIAKLEKGETYIKHIDGAPLQKLTSARKLVATADFSRARELDCLIICVPTPLTPQHE